jgi:hypothetical protein
MKRPVVGSVVLIKHSGEPQKWTVKRTGDDDNAHLLEIFKTAVMMCKVELNEGGTLLLLDVNGDLIKDHRGGVQ